MAEETKFTKAEVKFMYRAFKTECPNGIIDEETFKGWAQEIMPPDIDQLFYIFMDEFRII